MSEKKTYEGVREEVNVDHSAPNTVYRANISNYASMGATKKKDIGLQENEDTPVLEGHPGNGVLGSPLYDGLPKGEVGMVSKSTKKIQRK